MVGLGPKGDLRSPVPIVNFFSKRKMTFSEKTGYFLEFFKNVKKCSFVKNTKNNVFSVFLPKTPR